MNRTAPFYQLLARAAHSWSRMAVFVQGKQNTRWRNWSDEAKRCRELAKSTLAEAREAKRRAMEREAA